jgi:hypothetical protein
LKGKGRVVSAFAMCAHYLYDRFCNVAWAGRRRREKNVQDSRQRLDRCAEKLSPAWTLNACGRALRAPGSGHIPSQQFSVAEVLEQERGQMCRCRAVRRLRRGGGRVSTRLATVARNRYSVPCELAGRC